MGFLLFAAIKGVKDMIDFDALDCITEDKAIPMFSIWTTHGQAACLVGTLLILLETSAEIVAALGTLGCHACAEYFTSSTKVSIHPQEGEFMEVFLKTMVAECVTTWKYDFHT